MVEIKICGITRLEDALHAADCGADALGFIFYRKSLRYIDPEAAAKIIARLPGRICKVGVFVNENMAVVRTVTASCGIDLIQLHGDEPPDYCGQFDREALIKALALKNSGDLEKAFLYPVLAILIDARVDGRYGGTGERASWNLAADLGKRHPLILAGGLNRENITAALQAVRPHAVDINSGVEISPGKKDAGKVQEIIEMIRRGDDQGEHVPIFVSQGQKKYAGR
jgi:phosphoribosylanthranilate isomerase